jgi:hypothetical protein
MKMMASRIRMRKWVAFRGGIYIACVK